MQQKLIDEIYYLLMNYAVSCAKTDLHSKYIFDFVFSSFFEQDHVSNLFVLEVLQKAHANKHVFQNRNWVPFTEGKKWVYGVSFWKNGSFVYAELNKTVEAATSSYSATGEFSRYIYSVLVAKNHKDIWSKCLVDKFSFTHIFLNSILYGCGFLSLLWKGVQTDTHCNCIVSSSLRCYATFKVRKIEYLFYKVNTCLQKATTFIGLQPEQTFSVSI